MAAKMTDTSLFIQAGINPKTGLPIKMGGNDPVQLKENVKRMLRIIDEQDAVNRYVWYNLPANVTSQDLERFLYYKGQLAFFYVEELDEFFFMPYALDGTIDFYGRFNSIHPVPMANGSDENANWKKQKEYLSRLHKDCKYGVIIDEVDYKTMVDSAVILHDYIPQYNINTIIPRQQINDCIVDAMAECVPLLRTSLFLSSGVTGMRVNDADQWTAVLEAGKSLQNAALTGMPYTPFVGPIEFQEIAAQAPGLPEQFLLAMQSLDNLRLSTYGIDNGGLFEKKAHTLESEAAINGGPVGLVLEDGLALRQNFCMICNSIWDLGMWCVPAESVVNMDINGDGAKFGDQSDKSNGNESGEANDGNNNGGNSND